MADEEVKSPEEAAAARAAEQARIRKERREAKIKAGGSARLNKITGLGGGLQRDPAPPPQPSTTTSPAPTPQTTATANQQHADPDEVDISNAEHYYTPQTTNRVPPSSAELNDTQLRQMMLGFDPNAPSSVNGTPTGSYPNNNNTNPFAAMMASMGGAGAGANSLGGGAAGPDPDDPMMKMLSQMLGGAGGGAQNPFAAMAGAGGGGGGGPQQQQQQPSPAGAATSAAIWRMLHFLVAAGLGLYIALLTQFTGTKVARERGAFAAYTATTTTASDEPGANPEDLRKYFFWAFATAESVLLTTRFFLDKGARGPSGMVATALGFVPEGKWKSLVVNGLQYAQIFSTVRMDMLVCVFVLGVCSLVRG